ncbi:LamG-like jellyroll fold domain-containing protein [Burkholderia cenocepacia]|uniref:LamG-like jellyroll fold domain-containing protein n=1 Tax=Burkholderia cenocepacia TaxID=95486 RepID=UPI0022318E6C|nr:LamG-like jellyroll fold domain-containing protein [Burkholderia cenocepacia]MCW3610619.1 alginate lyase family protein [Burkholderia cenocepacia]MCW5191720.1 alginate lyase family protein [Burkholderia cenocepacia]
MSDTKHRLDASAGLSRRTFLYSLGAIALSACGSGTDTSESAAGRATGTATAAGDNRAHARAATGADAVTTSQAFAHPGLLHTQADFDRIAQKVAASASPWLDGWNKLIGNDHAQLSWSPRPQAVVRRGGTGAQNYPVLYKDIAAAYACALRWKISGNAAYADKAVKIMNVWSSKLQNLAGDSNVDLAAGIYGYEFANAGEIMRTYSGWAAADFAAFQAMMVDKFYPINTDFLRRHNNTDITHYWANWDLCNIASIMAIGVLCDDHAKFDEAVNYFIGGPGNGAIAQAVYYLHPGHLGQWQESGRDQGHNTLGIALGGAICEMAWNQGIDLYGHDNNRFLAGAEYVAKANLVQPDGTFPPVPYVPYANVDETQTLFSTDSQGTIRPCWALVYNHYVNRKGLAAPWSTKFARAIQPEGGGGNYGEKSGGYDQLGYGTLTYTRDPVASATAPSGPTAWPAAGRVVLSWWGIANATSYDVKRASAPGGPYTTVASGIVDPLTYTDDPAEGIWYYVIGAQSASGESANSPEVAASTALQLHTLLTFDEADGATAADASGNGHAGILVGGTSRVAGKAGNAVALDGASGYVALPNDIVADVSDFTIAAWVNWHGGQTWARIFDFGSGTGRYLFITPKSQRGTMRFAITTNGEHGKRAIDGHVALPAGRWSHVAVTLSAATAALYLDGNLIGSASDVIFAPWRIGKTAQNWIGRSQYAGDPFFNGMIDDFRLYRGAMSAEQVMALARSA